MIKSRILFLIPQMKFTFFSCNKEKQQGAKPNIILIMSDDMGYSDIGYCGGVASTLIVHWPAGIKKKN
jgi:arylsulfatase